MGTIRYKHIHTNIFGRAPGFSCHSGSGIQWWNSQPWHQPSSTLLTDVQVPGKHISESLLLGPLSKRQFSEWLVMGRKATSCLILQARVSLHLYTIEKYQCCVKADKSISLLCGLCGILIKLTHWSFNHQYLGVRLYLKKFKLRVMVITEVMKLKWVH